MADRTGKWHFDVVDVVGNKLTMGGLTLATNVSLVFQLIKPNTFACLLPLSAPEAQQIMTTIDAGGEAYIKGYRTPPDGTVDDRVLRFYGSVMVDEIVGQNGVDQLSIVAVEPLEILDQRFATLNYAASDLGAMLMSMIDTTNSVDGETGIRTSGGNIVASSTLDFDARQNKPSISSVADQFAGQGDGVEIWTLPTELAAGKICDFYASPMKGTTTTVVFGYGVDTESNCSAMSRARDKSKVSNTVNGFSDNVSSVKTNATSIAAIRNRVAYSSFTGTTSQGVIDAQTQGEIDLSSTVPLVAEYTCSPLAIAPRLFDDFQIGDTVYLHFKKGVEFGVNQRVMSAAFDVSTAGVERPSGLAFRT